jgi:hypothetical protein
MRLRSQRTPYKCIVVKGGFGLLADGTSEMATAETLVIAVIL